MNCFAHQEAVAVAICKCCAKGVCANCAIPVTNGIACSSPCATTAESLSQLQLISLRNSGIYRAQRMVQPIAAASLIFLGAAIQYSSPSEYFGWIMIAMGGLIALALIISAIRNK